MPRLNAGDLEELVERLRDAHFPVGQDQYLRAYQLMSVLEFEDRSSYRNFLGPVFSQSADEQARFQDIWKELYGEGPAAVEAIAGNVPAVQEVEKQGTKRRLRWRVLALLTMALALVAGAVWWVRWMQVPYASIEAVDLMAKLRYPTYPPAGYRPGGPQTAGEVRFVWSEAPSKESVDVGPVTGPDALSRFRSWLPWVTLAALLAVIAGAGAGRFAGVRRQRRMRPPYRYRLKTPEKLVGPAVRRMVHDIAYRWNRPERGMSRRMDAESTVRATASAAGVLQVRFGWRPRKPRYLALVERASARDQQAEYFADLLDRLQGEGVEVTRYYYERDPRLCFAGDQGGSRTLRELRETHADSRLVLLGDGSGFSVEGGNGLAEWEGELTGWEKRALLTPTTAERFGLREMVLSRWFVVLPATAQGWMSMAELLDREGTPQTVLGAGREAGTASVELALSESNRMPGEEAARFLEEYLGRAAFEWLCACAIHPEVDERLALVLADRLHLRERMSGADILRVFQLPVFRAGGMGEGLRGALARRLPGDRERAVRETLAEMLDEAPAAEGSYAEAARQLQLTIQQWRLGRVDKGALRQVAREAPESEVLRDAGVLRRGGDRWAVLARHGIPLLGMRRMVQAALLSVVVAGVSAGIAGVLDRFYQPTPALGSGTIWTPSLHQIARVVPVQRVGAGGAEARRQADAQRASAQRGKTFVPPESVARIPEDVTLPAADGQMIAVQPAAPIPQNWTQTVAPAPDAGFVRAHGIHMDISGQPFYFVGATNYYLHYSEPAMVDAVLDTAVQMGLRVMEMWAFLDSDLQGVRFQFQDPKTRSLFYNDGPSGLERLDYAIAAAGKRGIRLMLPLVNNWQDFGGIDAYVRWFGLKEHDDFYKDARAKQAYRDWVQHVLNRKNTVTGRVYKEEPAIMAWLLANEPRAAAGNAGALLSWVTEMSAFIKANDANHLVAVGDEGWFSGAGKEAAYNGSFGVNTEAFLKVRNIDFGTYHLFPDSKLLDGAGYVLNKNSDWGVQWIDEHVQLSNRVGKPVVLDQFALKDKAQRNMAYGKWLGEVYSRDAVGACFWMLAGPGSNGALYPDYDGYTIYGRTDVPVIAELAFSMGRQGHRDTTPRQEQQQMQARPKAE